jgi:hypothetical protein
MLTVITPTGSRPACFALAERWMARQSLQPIEWIVVDDGPTPTPCTMGQRVIRLPPRPDEHTLTRNIAAGLEGVTGKVCVCEDDDHYHPDYLAVMDRWLDDADMAGEGCARLYRPDLPGYMIRPNMAEACLAATGLADATVLQRAAAALTGECSLDLMLWRYAPIHKIVHPHGGLVTQLKAMPGRKGWTASHTSERGWCADPGGAWLRQRVGVDDAAAIMGVADRSESPA